MAPGKTLLAKSVGMDARVRIKPGERIALDGKIVSGRSAINQAPITGESLPVEKAEGDPCLPARSTNRARLSTPSPRSG
jgi:P-type E1-E2 ATPase